MDCTKTGALIRALRLERGLTQRALAERLNIAAKTVSKWETGKGAPDVSLLPALSDALGISIERLLSGDAAGKTTGGSLRRARYHFCPICGGLTVSTGAAEISCCGRKLAALSPAKPDEEHLLSMEAVEDEWYLTSVHPMTREHYITFVALIAADSLTLIRRYPEWDLQVRIPRRRGLLLWHCSRDGLFSKVLP